MVPAGYMAKRVVARPDWLPAERVSTIYSISGCISHNFADYIGFWKHNGYWLFDSPNIVTTSFSMQTSPECSPLSCNSLAAEVETNTRCLLQSFEQARALLEHGTFNNSEPGPFRIFAVYSVEWPATV